MFGVLLFLTGTIVLVYFLVRPSSKVPPLPPMVPQPPQDQLTQRNYEWAQFIANYYATASTDAERELVQRMLADIAARGLPVPALPGQEVKIVEGGVIERAGQSQPELSEEGQLNATAQQAYVQTPVPASPSVKLDNTSLLLYFGAFLFVASAGLFVGFGGLSGGLRTFIVLLVSLVLYAGGIWLHGYRKSLRQAAFAFVGIGMTIAPLTGLTAYNYLFDQSLGGLVWFLTSILCMVMYGHALWKLREPLLGYVFIFTFLSLFESGVSIVSAPLYYYGWAMALVGIILSIFSRFSNTFLELREPSRASAMLFIPLAVFVSLVLVPNHGAGQLGVSLLVAAAYYLLEAYTSSGSTRRTFAITAQISMISAIATLAFSVFESATDCALVLLIASMAQMVLLMLSPRKSLLAYNAATVAIGGQFVGLLLSLGDPTVLLISVIGLIVLSVFIAWHQLRTDAYALAMLSWTALPLIYGFVFSRPGLSMLAVSGLVGAALLVQYSVSLYLRSRASVQGWARAERLVYGISSTVLLVMSFLVEPWWGVLMTSLVALSYVYLAFVEKYSDWAVAAGIVAALPLLFSWYGDYVPGAVFSATIFALVINIGSSLWFKREASRWVSTILWLIVPLTLGSGLTGAEWSSAAYAWAYVVIMVGLIVSRAIARGVIMVSGKAVLSSFAKTASVSYVVGYCFAAAIALLVSLAADNSQLHTTLVMGVFVVALLVLGNVVEKRNDLLALVPIAGQFILWSALRPEDSYEGMMPFLLMSTALALFGYFGLKGFGISEKKEQAVRDGSLVSIFFTPAARLFVQETYWPMPVGLLVASGVLFAHVRKGLQANKEMVGGIALIAVYWLMYFWGVREFQAYAHMLVALLGFYAYWRFYRGERAQSDQYIWAALWVSTVPLAVQALSGQAGGVYGWWLLLEMIAWMLVGMAIGRRFVVMWGLYVSVAAVLYQLRGLGWAALTFLAIFLIGLAIYQIMRRERLNPPR